MSKKRIRIEFTAMRDGKITEWLLDKKLFTLRLMLKTQGGPEAERVFNTWLAETSEAAQKRKPRKRVGAR